MRLLTCWLIGSIRAALTCGKPKYLYHCFNFFYVSTTAFLNNHFKKKKKKNFLQSYVLTIYPKSLNKRDVKVTSDVHQGELWLHASLFGLGCHLISFFLSYSSATAACHATVGWSESHKSKFLVCSHLFNYWSICRLFSLLIIWSITCQKCIHHSFLKPPSISDRWPTKSPKWKILSDAEIISSDYFINRKVKLLLSVS